MARWLGIAWLAGRQLGARWLECLLILLGIALGVGVLTGMAALTRHQLAVVDAYMRLSPQTAAVALAPRRIDYTDLYSGRAAAIRVEPDLAEPLTFTLADLLALREQVPAAGAVYVNVSGRGDTVIAVDGAGPDSAADPLSAQGRLELVVHEITPDHLRDAYTFLAGSGFTWEDVLSGARRIVLDEKAAGELFPELPASEIVGRTVTTGAPPQQPAVWTVAGVVASSPPFDTVRSLGTFRIVEAVGPVGAHGEETYSTLYVRGHGAPEQELVRQVQAFADHRFGPGRVQVLRPQEGLGLSSYFTSGLILSGLALFIAALSLLNLFTARVLRRQRYVGTSIALGATRAMLFWQTAGEALLLGVLGSLAGLVAAAGVVRLYPVYARLVTGFATDDPWYAGAVLDPAVALIGFAVGTCVSLLFGLYPAWLAARREAAEALRSE